MMKLVALMMTLLVIGCGAPPEQGELQLGTAEQPVTFNSGYGVKTGTSSLGPQCDPNEVGAQCALPSNKVVYIQTNGVLSAAYLTALNTAIAYVESFAPAWDFYVDAGLSDPNDYDLRFFSTTVGGTPATAQDMPKWDLMLSSCLLVDAPWGPESYAALFKPCLSSFASLDLVKFEAWMTNVGASALGKSNYRVQLMCAALGTGALKLGDWPSNKDTCSSLLFTGKAGSGAGGAKMNLLATERIRLQNFDPTGGGVFLL